MHAKNKEKGDNKKDVSLHLTSKRLNFWRAGARMHVHDN
jgi:hypothetical protein